MTGKPEVRVHVFMEHGEMRACIDKIDRETRWYHTLARDGTWRPTTLYEEQSPDCVFTVSATKEITEKLSGGSA